MSGLIFVDKDGDRFCRLAVDDDSWYGYYWNANGNPEEPQRFGRYFVEMWFDNYPKEALFTAESSDFAQPFAREGGRSPWYPLER